jgi:pimeloyl-ACP methyl ester carboxylesterase
MPTVFVNGIHLYYEVMGQGEPLVIIGGLSIDISEYPLIIRNLSSDSQVIAFDNRGAGRTDKPVTSYSIEMMADDTDGLLTALCVSQAHVLGLSMGGRIAIALTLKHPERVKSLILVSTGSRVPSNPARTRRMKILLWLSRFRVLPGGYPQPYYAALRQLQASSSYDATARLTEIHVPTLILHGKSDRSMPYPLAADMHDRIQGSQIQVFRGGHLFFLLRPDPFLEAVRRFLLAQRSRQSHPSGGD